MFRGPSDVIRTNSKDKAESGCCGKGGFKCDMCDSEWLTETDVEIHRKKAHLRQLMQMIESKKHHICLVCVRDQGSPDALLSHIKSQHLLSGPNASRIEREVFICNDCAQIFFNKMMLAAHINYVHGTKDHREKNYISCPKCHKCVLIKKLWFHFSVHSFNIMSTCQICFTDCKSMAHLKEHLKTHPGHYHCEMCHYVTQRDRFFEDHVKKHKMRKVHLRRVEIRKYFVPGPFMGAWKYKHQTGLKGLQLYDLYVCILCREICSNKSEMRRHIFIDHAPETEVKRRLICSCGEEFFNNVLLKHHIFKMKGDHHSLEEQEMPVQINEEYCVTVKNEICGTYIIGLKSESDEEEMEADIIQT